MTDLPDPAKLGNSNNPASTAGGQNSNSNQHALGGVISSGNKEIVGGAVHNPEGLKDATGQEFNIPKEVQSAGVRMQPTTVVIPPSVASLGVKPIGANIPVQTASSVVLPLSDDQIAKGLHESITNSVRWLAEWCVRKLKFLHITLKEVHGKFIEVKEV